MKTIQPIRHPEEKKRRAGQIRRFMLMATIAACSLYNFITFLKVFFKFRQVPGYRTVDALPLSGPC